MLITVFLTLPDKYTASIVCTFAPRLRDVIIRNFNKKTLVLERRGRLIRDGENENLHSVIIRTLETIIVNDIRVVHGTPRVPAAVARGSRANSRGKAKPEAKGRTRPKGHS